MSEVVGPHAASKTVNATSGLLSKDVKEVYAPKRVADLCGKIGLSPGCSLDLTNGFDFDKASDRARAMKLHAGTQPELVTLSPRALNFRDCRRLTGTSTARRTRSCTMNFDVAQSSIWNSASDSHGCKSARASTSSSSIPQGPIVGMSRAFRGFCNARELKPPRLTSDNLAWSQRVQVASPSQH